MPGSGHIRLDNYMQEKPFKPIVNANFKEPHRALPTTFASSAQPFSLPSWFFNDFDTNKIWMSGSGQIRKDNYIPEKLYKPIVNANFKEPHLALPTTFAHS